MADSIELELKATANALFAKGIGGGELKEKLDDLTRAFTVAGAKSVDMNTRLVALGGGLLTAGRAALALGRQVAELGEALSDLSRRAHGGALTQVAVGWQTLRNGAVELGMSVVRLGEALGGAYVAVMRLAVMVGRFHPIFGQLIVLVEGAIGVWRNLAGWLDRATTFINGLTGATQELKPAIDSAHTATGILSGKVSQLEADTRAAKDATQLLDGKMTVASRAAAAFGEQVRALKNDMRDFSAAAREGETATDAIARMYASGRERLVQMGLERQNARMMARQFRQEAAAGHGRIGGVRVSDDMIASLTGVQAGPDLRELRGDVLAARAQQTFMTGSAAEVERARGETTEHWLRRELEHRRGIIAALGAQRTAELELNAAKEEGRRAALREANQARGQNLAEHTAVAKSNQRAADQERGTQAQRGDFGRQIVGQFGLVRNAQTGLLESTRTFAEQFSQAIGQGFQAGTQGITDFVTALASGQADFATGMGQMIRTLSQGLIAMAIPQAIFNLATGFAALATYRYDAAASAFTAAAIFGGLAAVGVAGAVAGSFMPGGARAAAPNPTAGGAGPRERSRMPSGAANDNGGGGTTVVINIDGHVYGGREFQDFLNQHTRASNRRDLMAA